MGIQQAVSRRHHSRFEQLVLEHSQAIYSHAWRLTRDHGRAEDLVQEVFLRAWQHLTQLRQPHSARSWLIAILRREHLRWLDKQGNGHAEQAPLGDQAAPYSAEEALQQYQLRQAILQLPPGYLEPMLMQVLGGYSIHEIAQALALSESAVQSRLYRARNQLSMQLRRPGQRQPRPFIAVPARPLDRSQQGLR